jgi:peptide/nickel transport system substrate-binding protein
MRGWRYVNLASFMLMLLVTACSGPAQPARPTTSQGATENPTVRVPSRINAAMMSSPPTISRDNVIAGSGTYQGGDVLEELMTGGLTQRDANGSLRPQLAEVLPTADNGRWKLFPDGRMETTWTLRPNLFWHDGVPVTAEDFVFTATISQDKDLPVFAGREYRLVESIEATDARTIVMKWKQPYIRADEVFLSVRPKHILEPAYLAEKTSVLQHPYWSTSYVGAGPYKLREFVLDSHLLMEAYDQYVLGRPKVDEIRVRFITDDNALIAHILAGEVDLTIGRNISAGQAVQLRDRWPEGSIDVGFENWIALWPQMMNPTPAAILDVRFRRAILHGSDRQAIVEATQHGLTEVAHSMVPPSDSAFKAVESSIVRYDYDPRRAAALIEEMGFTRGADGMFRDASGQLVPLDVRTSGGDDAHETGVFTIAENLKRVGLNTEPFLIPQAQRDDRAFNAQFPGVRLWRGSNSLFEVDRFHGREAAVQENRFSGGNRSRYLNPEYDGLIDSYMVTIPLGERQQILARIVRHMTENLNVMGLWFNTEPAAVSKRVVGFTNKKTTGAYTAWNAHEWEVRR